MKIEAGDFCERLKKNGVSLVCGVPDSLLKNLISCIGDKFEKHIITANEGNAVALAAGHYLATSKPAAVYLQNSGLGNCVNPILSLTDKDVYKIPFLMIIGYRGEPDTKDEPQHYKQGLLTLPILECMGIEYKIFDNLADIDNAFKYMTETGEPFALVIRKDTFTPYRSNKPEIEENLPDRESAITAIAETAGDKDIFVSTTGMISRELYEYRKNNGLKSQDFLTVGSMGHASSIACGIALEKLDRNVIILDGDGASLMHMGAIPVIASLSLPNIKHILLNNGAHDSVGGQPTIGRNFNFTELAKISGYSFTVRVSSIEKLKENLQYALSHKGSSFLEVAVRKGNRSNLGRPKETPQENKELFMKFISDN